MLDARTSASLVPVHVHAVVSGVVHAVVSGVHNGRHDRTAFRTPHAPSYPAGHRPLPPARHGEPEATRTGERTNGTEGTRTPSIATTPKTARRDTPSPLLWGRRLRLSNQGWLGDGNTASATETTAATRSLLGVALSSKPRLGALLSSDDFGSSVERTAKLHPLWRGQRWGAGRGAPGNGIVINVGLMAALTCTNDQVRAS
jgi:hypothetical protein